MAFKKTIKNKQSVQLVSFMDMIFMLLIFYLVTGYNPKTSFQEKNLYIPTPKNELGRAQMVLQFVDSDRMFWLDESAADIVSDTEDSMGFLPVSQLNQAILDKLLQQCLYSSDEFGNKLKEFVDRANQNSQASFFVMIRVPHSMPFYRVADVISTLSNTQFQNIKYGCIPGTLEQFKGCREIKTVLVEDRQGNRKKNLRIDF